MKNLTEFWLEVAQDTWFVQDFSVIPDQRAAYATVYDFWHGFTIKAHMPELRMSGKWIIHLRHRINAYEATYAGEYTYCGRGAHRDACLGSLTLERLVHSNLFVSNDDICPNKLEICMKFTTPYDKGQETDSQLLKIWSAIPAICHQFPRFMFFHKAKQISGLVDPKTPQKGVRSVIISEKMGDGKTVGKEMKAIYDDPARRNSREIFVLCMRFMMWGFQLQKEHCKAQRAFLQDMHPENCVFMHGVPKTNDPHLYKGKASKYTMFRLVDANGWWMCGESKWRELYSLFGCIFDVIESPYFKACPLNPVHFDQVRHVPWM